jgi:4-alpha-glucanotransferase
MPFDRSSGLLLHISSLPSYGGIGDLGPAAYAFADFLASGKQRLWQVLPLGPTGFGNSPYSSLSAFAGNPLLISLEKLVESGWLRREKIAGLPGEEGKVRFDQVASAKSPLLIEAARNFLAHHDSEAWERFALFREENQSWLGDYAAYAVLRQKFHSACWQTWPKNFAHRDAGALRQFEQEHAAQIEIEKAIQFAFDEQWRALRAYCAARQIRFIGDVAIFVNYDSADVWTHPGIFDLRDDLTPNRVAGVPPDYFSATGQRWGNPLYRWDVLAISGFAWWLERIRRARALFDIMRLDHFRGFEAFWSIPAEDETAVRGEWIKAPGAALFRTLREQLGDLPFIAEDLGLITPEVDALREQFGLPGMRVLQFGFSGPEAHTHLPHRYDKNCVVYTGTHDNDTTLGWWQQGATRQEKIAVQTYLHPREHDVVWSMIRAVSASVADICLLPVQDILVLGSEARMNIPAKPEDNWTWRMASHALTEELATGLKNLTEITDRDLRSLQPK